MSYEFDCTGCGKRLRIPDSTQGQLIRCPHCESLEASPLPAVEVADLVEQQNNTEDPIVRPNPYAEDLATPPPFQSPVGTPFSGQSFPSNLATPLDRLLGAIIDLAFFAVCLAPGATTATFLPPEYGEPIGGLVSVLGALVATGLQYYLITTSGQSVGKRVMKTRIVLQSGTPPGFVHGVILRHWILKSTFALCYPIAAVLKLIDFALVFSEKRQCLHDLIASTYVISEKNE